jgi:hypothetical protein
MKLRCLPLILALVVAGCGGGISAYKLIDYDSLIKSGWLKYNQNKFLEAQNIFTQAKEYDSARAEGYIGCGWSLLMRQEPDSALVEFFHGMPYSTTLNDSVDTICGVAGSYLAANENKRLITYLSPLDFTKFEDVFPLKDHDFFINTGNLEMVLAQAYYRMGQYSATESPDPANALYHLQNVLVTPYTYTNPEDLMAKMTEYLSESGGGL